ncbi:GNAT family N-acetyltransferase [Kineothrix sp. MB12-C1]|uniref:GNAT family N-acetyltransferase n=1 Tax=Kineothrix sp. MB12-C1 TaxID=3070215 RepID=UPI0027D2182F|nr:GNAT family protein [Kineothrix sp. MB12-C1]WMC92525.1 GNAT family protein [Kineothrix sp. MB12-C1]
MIETERLTMRSFNEDDFDIMMSLYSNEEIMKYMPNDVMSAETAQKHLNKVICDWGEKPRVNFEMAVILKYNQEKIGRSRIHLDYETDTAIIGWLLLKKIGSWRVLEKCNMRREVHFIQNCKYIKNSNVIWEDELEYAILESER